MEEVQNHHCITMKNDDALPCFAVPDHTPIYAHKMEYGGALHKGNQPIEFRANSKDTSVGKLAVSSNCFKASRA